MLGPNGTGHFQVFTSTQSIIATIFSLGLGQASIYYINNKGYSIQYIVSLLIKFYIPLACITTVGVALLVSLCSSYFGNLTSICLILYSIGTSALLFTTSLRAILLADLNVIKTQTVQYVSQIFILVIVMMLFIGKFSLSVNTLLIIYSLGNIISAIWLVGYFKKSIDWKRKFDHILFKPLCKLGVIMSTSNIASIIYLSSPVYALTWFYSNGFTSAGLYSRALSIMTIATFTVQSVGPLLYSKMSSSSLKEKIHQGKISAHSFFIFNVAIMLIIILLAPFLVRLLYGAAFVQAADYLRLLAIALPFNGIISVGTNLLSSEGLANKVVSSLSIGVFAFWISQFALIIFSAPILVCVCVILANVVTGIFMSVQTKKYFGFSIIDYFPFNVSDYMKVFNLLYRGIK